jgi:hypothetical protein
MKLKALTKQSVTVLAVVAGLTLAVSTQAQYITGGQYLQNATTGGGYGGWSSATFTYTPTGIEVQAPVSGGYGGAYFVINSGVQTINPAATEVQLTLTVNGDPNPYIWFSPGQLVLNDDLPLPTAFYYNMPYNGYGNGGNPAPPEVVWNGSTVTITEAIQAGQLAKIQGGNDHIYAFSLDLDPAVITTPMLDVTFNSIQFIPVPEPATVTLVVLGLVGVVALRRRHTS